MAARRLILVMLVLLGISTAIAMITPQPESPESSPDGSTATGASGATGTEPGGTTAATGTSGATGTTAATGATGSNGTSGSGDEPGETVVAVIEPDGAPVTVTARPEGRVILTVKVKETAEIEIPALGRIDTATRFAPARFDLLLPPGPGDYPVTDLGTGRTRATIEAPGPSAADG